MTPDLSGPIPAAEAPMAPSQAAWILECDVPAPGAPQPLARRFRIGQHLFQEWSAQAQAFGPNLCEDFACSADRGQLTGSIGSASLALTITVDPTRRAAQWRTQGASGLSQTEGSCSVAPQNSTSRNAP